MNALSAKELKVLNNLSMVHDSDVELGTKIQELINVSGKSATPINAKNAQATLGVSGVSVDGETFTIGNSTYEFLADDAQTKTVDTNIAINISTKATKASSTLTIATQPTSGDTMTIGGKTYIFVPVGTANHPGEISIGDSISGAQAAITLAINGTDGVNEKHPSVSIGSFSSNSCTITALVGGTIGNSIATTETFTAANNVFSSATLASGSNCSAVNTKTAIIEAVSGNVDSEVEALTGSNNNVLVVAKVAGKAGNEIVVSDTMANGSFGEGVTTLSGGLDGTVAVGTQFCADESYLYICLNGNDVSGKNWRRVAVGDAY